jgi:hypothetical protein
MFCCVGLEKLSRIVCCFAVLLLSMVANAQQAGHTLNNEDIIKMTHDGFDEAVIVALIATSPTDFDVSINGLNTLKDANVTGKVMEAMLKAEAKKRQGTVPIPSAQSASPAPSAPVPAMVANPAMSVMGGGNMQQMMAMAMSMQGGGMLDTSQLPPLTLITDVTRLQVKPSIAQIANTQTKGDGMPGAGSQATGMLMGLGRQALSFGAIGGGMFAGPGASMAMGMVGGLGGMGRHHGPPKVTYVWALPGQQSATAVASNKPRFEMSFGNLLGIDPDAYEPQLIKLVSSKDNWRLVGATKTTMGQMGTEAYEKVTEARVAVKSERTGRGQVQLEPKQPLEPGEYAVVLRAIHAGKRAEGSLGGGAETSIFFSVWDFSVNTAPR